jgi:hypothetical protein
MGDVFGGSGLLRLLLPCVFQNRASRSQCEDPTDSIHLTIQLCLRALRLPWGWELPDLTHNVNALTAGEGYAWQPSPNLIPEEVHYATCISLFGTYDPCHPNRLAFLVLPRTRTRSIQTVQSAPSPAIYPQPLRATPAAPLGVSAELTHHRPVQDTVFLA